MTPIFTLCNVFIKAEERGELQLPMANRSAYSHILFQDYDPMEAVQRLDIILFHQIIRSIINRWGGESPQPADNFSSKPHSPHLLVRANSKFSSFQYYFSLVSNP